MVETNPHEEELLQSVALQNAASILRARQRAEQELVEAKEALRQSTERITRILESITDGFLVLDSRWRFTYVNPKAEEMLQPLGKTRESLLGGDLWEELPALLGTDFERAYRRALAEQVTVEVEGYYPPLAGFFAARAYPSADGLSIYLRDVTRRKEAEVRLASERAVLELIASGAPLAQVLTQLVREAESQSHDGMLCSVLLVDGEGERLRHGAAPSLPAAYNEAIDGLRLRSDAGSWVAGAFDRPPARAADTSDPRGAAFEALAARHGLRACGSTPIFSSQGNLLGAIASYYREPRAPSPADDQIVANASRLAAIAIERTRAEEALRRSEQFNRSIIESSRDCLQTLTLDGVLTWISDNGLRALCVTDPAAVVGRSYVDLWAGEDREQARAAVEAAAGGGTGSFVGHLPLPEEARWWEVVITPVRDRAGRPESLLAVSRDVTERIASESRLRESEEQLRHLANTIPQLAWMAEPAGDISWFNQGWYGYTGATLEQMQGWGWQTAVEPQSLPAVLEGWRQSIATGEPFEMEFPLRGADGVFRWFLTRVNPMRDASGRVVRWFGTNTDVDQVRRIRHALEEETRILELLNRTGTTLAASLDQESLVQTITDAATQLSGARFGAFFYNVLDAQGQAYMLYTLSGAPREAFEGFGHPRATALFGPTFRGEAAIRCDDVLQDPRYGRMEPHHGMPPGHLPVRSYLAVPVISRSGEVIGGLFFGHPEPGVFTARTERLIAGVAAQAAVAIDNARLYEGAQKAAEDRKVLLESERHARSAAERASRMKDEFLTTLSHELRTPLSAILGWSHLLRAKPPGAEELTKGLETIERNARAQTQLIDDLLDMSRIASGKVRLDVQPVQPAAFIEEAVHAVRPAAEAKGIRLETLLDPLAGPIHGDPNRLQQVIWNLLSNAIKFTPREGRVQVVLERVRSHIEISVADTGAGIEPAFLEHVFERFRQADASTTRQYGGLGLGLAIVKHLLELHGGTVGAQSPGPGQGSTFTVTLPLAVVHRTQEADQRRHPTSALAPLQFEAADLSAVKVVVVDDQADARDLVARVLSECGAQVITAASAGEALFLVERERPHVLVTDIGMPDVDGFELLRRVRALGEARGGKVPAIALTAFARSEDRTRALQHGFRVHVAKPVEPSELIASVASVVERTGGVEGG